MDNNGTYPHIRFRIKHRKFSEIITAFRPFPVRGNGLRNVKMSENCHSLILNLGMHIILIHAVFGKCAYPRFTRYADYIRFCHKQNLKVYSWQPSRHYKKTKTHICNFQSHILAFSIKEPKCNFENCKYKFWSLYGKMSCD